MREQDTVYSEGKCSRRGTTSAKAHGARVGRSRLMDRDKPARNWDSAEMEGHREMERYRDPTIGDPEKKWNHRQGDKEARTEPWRMKQKVSDNSSPCSETGAPHTVGPGAKPAGGPTPARLCAGGHPSLYIEQKCELRHQPRLGEAGWDLVRQRAT